MKKDKNRIHNRIVKIMFFIFGILLFFGIAFQIDSNTVNLFPELDKISTNLIKMNFLKILNKAKIKNEIIDQTELQSFKNKTLNNHLKESEKSKNEINDTTRKPEINGSFKPNDEVVIKKRFGIDGTIFHEQFNFPKIISELGGVVSGVNAICYYEDNPIKTQKKLNELDKFYEAYAKEGVELQVNLLSCMDYLDGGAPVTKMPKNPIAYKKWIQKIVSKYKGKIHYYQIDNEPSTVSFLGTKEEFVMMLNFAYDAIKEIDENATVMSSGWSFFGLFLDNPSDQEIKEILIKLQKTNLEAYKRVVWTIDSFLYTLKNGKYDVVSMHQNRYYNAAKGLVKKIREYTDKPIIFEDMMSGPSSFGFLTNPSKQYPKYLKYYNILEDKNNPNYKAVRDIVEAEHSSVLVKKSVFSFVSGVEKVFLVWTIDILNFPIIMYKHAGLLGVESYNPQKIRKKPAFYTTKLMVSKLDGFTKAEKLNDCTYKFSFKTKKPVYVLWYDHSDESKIVDLSAQIVSEEVLITNIITEPNKADQDETNPTIKIGKTKSIIVNKTPVFVEEKINSSNEVKR